MSNEFTFSGLGFGQEAIRFVESLRKSFLIERGREATLEEINELVERTNREAMLN